MLLKMGSEGPAVTEWQVAMSELGYFDPREYYPKFGPRTIAATKAFQADSGLAVDGIVGPNTRSLAKRRLAELSDDVISERSLSSDDKNDTYHRKDDRSDDQTERSLTLDELANRAGIPVRVLMAIRHVESRGNPSAIRFEPHLFHRKRPDLASRVPYTKSDRGYSTVRSETNRSALERAMRLDAKTAIESASFGKYQVLGGYLLDAYGNDPQRAYNACKGSPSEASDLMVAAWFRDNRRAMDAANSNPPDFKKLARCYNGPNYHVHKYDEQLEKAWKESNDEEVTVS